MTGNETLPDGLTVLLRGNTGSIRYGYEQGTRDRDWFILTPNTDRNIQSDETGEDFFLHSVRIFKNYLCHPLILGVIAGDCTGDQRLCEFLRDHRRGITYAAPGETARYGLDYIAVGERYGYKSPIKAGLRTAMILSHMAEEREDPFLLSDEEKSVLIRARTGKVPPEERMELYSRTICPENLDKLRKVPENTKVRDELFALLDTICKEETP